MGQLKIKRGDIFRIKVDAGAEQTFLVIQNDIGNRYCQSVMAVPLTRNVRARSLFFALTVQGNSITGLEQDYAALFFQIRTLARERFDAGSRLGTLDNKAILKMDEMLKLSLGLSTLQQLEDRFNRRKSS